MGRVLIAFSGGVDSTFLVAVAKKVLGHRVLAVTARSEIDIPSEYEEALRLARRLGVAHRTIETSELDTPNFAANPIDRCYHCKKALFNALLDLARREGIPYVLDGSNADDASDFRPGMRALRELGVRSPLKESGLTKGEIRILSKDLGLPTWNKPAMACLASRFPYGTEITPEKLERVARAEAFLRKLGFSQVRVRHHEEIVRIEVPREEIGRLTKSGLSNQIVEALKALGYRYVTIDLEGYRTGSLNETLSEKEKKAHGIQTA